MGDWKSRATGKAGGGPEIIKRVNQARDTKEISSKLRKVEGV